MMLMSPSCDSVTVDESKPFVNTCFTDVSAMKRVVSREDKPVWNKIQTVVTCALDVRTVKVSVMWKQRHPTRTHQIFENINI